MEKKIFRSIIYGVIFCLFSLLGLYCFEKINKKNLIKKNILSFQNFCAFSINNNQNFCTKSLPKQPIIILFIHPECDFCIEEIKQLKESQVKFKNTSILLITSASLKQVIDFYSEQNLAQLNNVQLLLDKELKISNSFGINIIPSVFVYNTDKELIFSHKNEIKIETLIRYLSEK
ncbi:MAG: peroxiredoxin family protein [Dysgonamonadaceae bacterium]|jgi:alkyl hydroperoxide reductase subunit AhpC|nr:peroxiredoxin family protein [Dysgonamonadaceae bacterium]